MSNSTEQSELLLVEKPGRYVSYEVNIHKKSWNDAFIRWALVFPDVYEVGLSHLGLRILYHKLNQTDGVLADRAYTPWPDREKQLRNKKQPLCSHELNKPLNLFDFLGFSLQYELSYTNILTVLDLANIPLMAKNRSEKDPFVVAGGPCTFHAEPVADFFDFMVVGEAEETLEEIRKIYTDWKESKSSRQSFLEEIRKISGIYVPSFFSIKYKPGGEIEAIIPQYADYQTIKKRIIEDIDTTSPIYPRDIVPVLGIVHDRLNVEIARGCTRGCRFCQAGFVYRPVRERHPERVLEYIKEGLKKTGYEEISLLSLSTGDYSAIQTLIPQITSELIKEKIAISLPSLRVGTLTSEIVESIKSIRKTGFTLAPEAGSERLRQVINKQISTDELIETARYVFHAGWKLLKLYFMIGLPTEQNEDIEALIDLCITLWKTGKSSRGRLHVSVSTFVPKPHTPFQWCGQAEKSYIEATISYLKKRFRPYRSIELKWHNPGQSFWEAVMARGDRRLGKVILKAWQMGARLDGWTELFREDIWREASKLSGINPEFYANRTINTDEVLPWSHISCGVSTNYLKEEYKKALEFKFTGDCRTGKCTKCGVCDFKTIQPLLWKNYRNTKTKRTIPLSDNKQGNPHWYKFIYTKLGKARFFPQVDIQRLLSRAARRAGLPMAYSKGFHPAPRMSFLDALPVGVESLCEIGWIAFEVDVNIKDTISRWNSQLLEGISILEMTPLDKKPTITRPLSYTYRLENMSREEIEILNSFITEGSSTITLRKKNTETSLSVQEVIKDFNIMDSHSLEISIEYGNLPLIRPLDILISAGISKRRALEIRILKTGMEVQADLDRRCGDTQCIVN